jgi:DNA polymerase III alpha subunit
VNFVHLHVHSQYSFLDGASSLDRLLEKAKSLGMSALALTDHNRLTGAIRFYEKARGLGIKPIIGAKIDVDGGYHITLLCKDKKGYSNLCRLITEASLTNKGRQLTVIKETLSKFNDGLIALSGCSKGEMPELIETGRIDEARRSARFYGETFGEDFFVELIRYPSSEGMKKSHMLSNFERAGS